MTLLWNIARVGAVVALLVAVVAILPDAPDELDELTIPSLLWDPFVAVLALDRYLPIHESLIVAGLALSIRAGMFLLWVYSWIARHVFGS